MKFFAAVAAIALASVSTVSATECSPVTLATSLSSLVAPATACEAATGYTIIIATALPTAEQLKQICAQCKEFLTATKSVTFPKCTVEVYGMPTDIGLLVTTVTGQCSGGATPSTTIAAPTTTKTPTTENSSTTKATETPNPNQPTATVTLPAPAPTRVTSGLGAATIVGAASGFIVVVLLVMSIICLLRHKRHGEIDQAAGAATTYVNLSDAPTDDTRSGHDLLRSGLALAAMRIPYKNLTLGEVVSQGGFGEVLVGVYNHKTVAIKRLLTARRRDPHNIRSFFKEIQLTAPLDHECIVKFIGVAWDLPANLCMVSEFMCGGDLRSLLVRYSLQDHPNGHDDGKLRIAVQVAHAMTYLHSLETPVVHRDLKSRNILLTESMDAKVIDFGISCERQDVTMTAGVGTSLWMAPEVMLGERYDEKADVFSFGVVLSELDTHALPYDHARDVSSNRKMADMVLMNLIAAGQLKPRFTRLADPDMVALARDCLNVDPAKRPRASQVLYRIHKSRQYDRSLSAETRMAMESGLNTVETRATTRNRTTGA